MAISSLKNSNPVFAYESNHLPFFCHLRFVEV